jgi:hypothetical protein
VRTAHGKSTPPEYFAPRAPASRAPLPRADGALSLAVDITRLLGHDPNPVTDDTMRCDPRHASIRTDGPRAATALKTPGPLRQLLRVKKRRVEQLEAARDAARAAELECRQGHEAAQQQEQVCREAELAHQRKIIELSTSVKFFASDLITMTLISDALTIETRGAQRATEQAERAVEAARALTLQALRALQRGEQQLDRVKEHLAQAIAAAVAADDDTQDEDAEEAAVSRMIARSREAIEA